MKTLRTVLLLFLLCLAAIPAGAGSSQLDLQQNGMYITTDGEEAFFFLPDAAGNWTIQSASNHFQQKNALYTLPQGETPLAMLYADAKALWFACYNTALQYEEGGRTWSAATVYKVNRENTTMEAILTNADPQGLYPTDGSGLYYVPWDAPGTLRKIDFLTAHNQQVCALEDETIWSVTQSAAGLFALSIGGDGATKLYRVTEGLAEALPLPDTGAADYWLQGDYCIAKAGDSTALYAIPLADTEQINPLPEELLGTTLYRFGNMLLGLEEGADGYANVYHVNLENSEIVKGAYYDAPPFYFVLGHGGGTVTVLDGMGRLLQIPDDFETLLQVAQVDMAALYQEGAWVYALAFDDYILLLGYRQGEDPGQPGDRTPPTLAKIIPWDTGMHQDTAENAVG